MKFPEMLTGVQHIGVPTNDLEKTVAFYENIGFKPGLETVNEAETALRSTRRTLKRRSQRRRKRGLRCSTTRFTGCRFGRTA